MSAQTGFTVWFTGLSGAGKSALAQALRAEIQGGDEPLWLVAHTPARRTMTWPAKRPSSS